MAALTNSPDTDRSIIYYRVFNAPRDLVFEAWTDPEHLAKWFGPAGFSITTHEMEFAVGGIWDFDMHGPDGTDYPNCVRFNRIDRPGLIDYDHVDRGDRKTVLFNTVVTFEADGDRTRLTMDNTLPSREVREQLIRQHSIVQGGNQTLDRLEAFVGSTSPQLKITAPAASQTILVREFDAPADLLYAVWSSAEHLSQWFGPHGVDMPVCELDPHVGGAIRFCHETPDGTRLWIKGTYDEVVPNERLVFTTTFTDEAGNPSRPAPLPDMPLDASLVTTVTFEPRGARTLLTVRQETFPAELATNPAVAEERDMAREGWVETFERLVDYVASQAA